MRLLKLKELREFAGVTQEDLARRSDMSVRQVANVESGKETRAKTAKKFAKALGVKVEELKGEGGEG